CTARLSTQSRLIGHCELSHVFWGILDAHRSPCCRVTRGVIPFSLLIVRAPRRPRGMRVPPAPQRWSEPATAGRDEPLPLPAWSLSYGRCCLQQPTRILGPLRTPRREAPSESDHPTGAASAVWRQELDLARAGRAP